MNTILVTGGAGFVGSNLAISFKKEFPKAKVVAFDNLKRRGSELNLVRLKNSGVEFAHGDIRNREDFGQVKNFDLLIECSAEPSVHAGYGESPAYLIDTNLGGTLNCLEAARQTNASFIFMSTSRVYPIKGLSQLKIKNADTRFVLDESDSVLGISNQGINENFSLGGSRSLYGATKLASELMITEYAEMYGMRTLINRCGVIAGPWQMGKVDQGFMVLWVARHLFGGKLTFWGYGGTGLQVRDILHIDDFSDLIKLQVSQIDKLRGEVFNIGGGIDVSVSLQELTSIVQNLTQTQIPIERITETRSADIPYYVSDNQKVQKILGWKPQRSRDKIVNDIVEWVREYQTQLKPILT